MGLSVAQDDARRYRFPPNGVSHLASARDAALYERRSQPRHVPPVGTRPRKRPAFTS
ncbi:hypothetical protein [Nonomuraea sp. NPDC023979]|uniref:hypothetical protein n=1 Tax=Nonomuraea sp. NPDC023979 TaxID=3154796 RepID=UPI0033C45E2D